MKDVLQYCAAPSHPSAAKTHEQFVAREARKAQFSEDMFTLMGGGKEAPSGAAIALAGSAPSGAGLGVIAPARSFEATSDAVAARQRNADRARQNTCPFGTSVEDPAAQAPTLQPRLGGVPEAPSERARSMAFADAQKQARLFKGRGVGIETPFDEHGDSVGMKSFGEKKKPPRGSLVPEPASQTPVLDARAEAAANKAKQQQRKENPIVGNYRDPTNHNLGKGKGPGYQEQLMPEAQMQLMRQGVKSLTAEQAMHANTKVLAESNRERNLNSKIFFED